MAPSDLDLIDRQIIDLLQRDGRMSHSAIAEAVGLSQPAVHDRVKKLEQRGVIKGYTALVDPESLNLSVLALISVSFQGKPADSYERVALIPQVLEAHHITGDDCLMVKVRCRSTRDLETVLDRIWEAGPVASTKTTIVFSSYKETMSLPVAGCGSDGEAPEG